MVFLATRAMPVSALEKSIIPAPPNLFEEQLCLYDSEGLKFACTAKLTTLLPFLYSACIHRHSAVLSLLLDHKFPMYTPLAFAILLTQNMQQQLSHNNYAHSHFKNVQITSSHIQKRLKSWQLQ